MVSQVSAPVYVAKSQPKAKANAADEFKKIPDKIDEQGKVLNDSLDKVNNTMKKTTESVGAIAITGTGLIATLKKPFVGILNWMKEAKIDPKTGEEILDKAGNVVKQISKKKAVGVAIAAAIVVATVLFKHVKNSKEAKKAEAVQQAQQAQNAEPSKPEHKLDVVSE